jgi:hypothetical protein
LGFSAYVLLVGSMVWRVWPGVLGRRGTGARTPSLVLLVGLLGVGLGGMTISIENYRGLWILLAVMDCYARLAVAPALTVRTLRAAPSMASSAVSARVLGVET